VAGDVGGIALDETPAIICHRTPFVGG
jgi:hypothetical protein